MRLDTNILRFVKNFYFLLLNNKRSVYILMSKIGLVPAVTQRARFDSRDVSRPDRVQQAEARFLAPETSDWTKNGLFLHGR